MIFNPDPAAAWAGRKDTVAIAWSELSTSAVAVRIAADRMRSTTAGN
ncbi:hypothetical protein SIAM614_22447 [Stappia aggregata IAM 12614]|uniref:Uncharacterized protein n=1 Tax=Roseibium aggregatum (strain ATCC 25650 / DSM 13394 / JCM 20685 / NBRC 16684 / NCIMB 2208 / IAM 12614 / B1) TaxID=384765 RepID=A0NY45_ROSAI|nr:hypothetical protein SIAM614_22447 [Stappia aggregata IAM 12614] [Roseibium aggregatum IAM 12614]